MNALSTMLHFRRKVLTLSLILVTVLIPGGFSSMSGHPARRRAVPRRLAFEAMRSISNSLFVDTFA